MVISMLWGFQWALAAGALAYALVAVVVVFRARVPIQVKAR
jgi:hypothetical protein